MKLDCPSCGAEIEFKSRFSVFGVCSYCSSTVVRRDLDLEVTGKMASLPPDMSPLQIGTRGKYEGVAFELVGRLKIGWEDGLWSEWFALFEDGRSGWLAEAQGFFMMSFEITGFQDFPSRSRITPGQAVRLTGKDPFYVDDLREASCIGSEGELPFQGLQGRKSLSVDLRGPGGLFANIEYSDDGARVFVGRYVELEEAAPSPLRQLDGW